MVANRGELRRRLFAHAAEQAGFFTAAQAKSLGYSYQAQAHHVASGNWRRVEHGVFRLAEWLPDQHDDLVRWTLWSKNRAVVSHDSALAVHEIGEFESRRVQLTVPPGFVKRADGVTLHRAALPDSDVRQRLGFRVTTPTRSLIDVAARSPEPDQLARAVNEARRGGFITVAALLDRAEVVDARAALHLERAVRSLERA